MGPKKKTRQTNPCYGPPTGLPDTCSLYTLRDVLAGVEFEKLQQPELNNSQIHNIIENKVRQKFQQANPHLALITASSATSKIRRAFISATLLGSKKLKSNKKKHFLASLDKLFDLVICQCEIVDCAVGDHKYESVHINCNCERKDKIPNMELAWLRDQRVKIGTTGGKYVLGGVDKKEAKIFDQKVAKDSKKITSAVNISNKERKVIEAQELAKLEFETEFASDSENLPNDDVEFRPAREDH